MIDCKETLTQFLKVEKKNYLGDRPFHHWMAHTKNWVIWSWQKHLRKEEYYSSKMSLRGKIMYLWHKRLKNIMGQKLGFDVPIYCFDIGLNISHISPVTINSNARIRKNCMISGNICVGSKSEGAPIIGDYCQFGYGSIVIGNICLGNNITIGAGSVVLTSFEKDGIVLAGTPAKIIGDK